MQFRKTLILTASLAALAATSVFAQSELSAPPMGKHDHAGYAKLTPEQREARHAAFKEKLAKMTPEERQKFRAERKAKWEERYKNATPEEQAKMKERHAARKARWKANHEAGEVKHAH